MASRMAWAAPMLCGEFAEIAPDDVDLYVDRVDISKRRLWWWRKPVTLTCRSTPPR
jgi:hypothetical protein